LGETKNIWATAPKAPSVCEPEQNRRQKVFHWVLHVCARELNIPKIYF